MAKSELKLFFWQDLWILFKYFVKENKKKQRNPLQVP